MKYHLLFAACSAALAAGASAAPLSAVTFDNRLVTFDSSNPGVFLSSYQISGLVGTDGVTLDPGASLINHAYNPVNGLFYGIDTNANFYSLTSTGVATLINATFSPAGFDAGFAYDPLFGGFSFASDLAENVRIAPNGNRTSLTPLVYGAGDANAASTPAIFGLGIDPDLGTSFFVDAELDILSQGIDPDFTELFTIGSLGLNVTSAGGLTVDFEGNLFGAFSTDGVSSSLYSIDTASGVATEVGKFEDGNGVYSVAAVPEPAAAASFVIGATLIGLFRRRRA